MKFNVAKPQLIRGFIFRKTVKIAGPALHNEKSRYSKQLALEQNGKPL